MSRALMRSVALTLRRERHPAPSSKSLQTALAVLHQQSLQQKEQQRWSSQSSMSVTTGPPRKKVTVNTLRVMKDNKEPITMVTAHDFPVADVAGVDMLLVGDSLSMISLGMNDTSEVGVDEMLLHCRSVARATKGAFIVGDLPMGSYEVSPEQALLTAIRFIKEGRVQAVKLEGGKEMAPTISKLTSVGIPVVAHIGLTPQRLHALGGFRVQGKSSESAYSVFEDAVILQEAGAFAIVLEAIPAEVAEIITSRLTIPTIGIGAGTGCAGQVLVQADMNGNFPPGRFLPKFVKKYGDVWGESLRAVTAYKDAVKTRQFPESSHTYPVSKEQLDAFELRVHQTMGPTQATGGQIRESQAVQGSV
ncbi:3-methyl-2-oxobutanoate hydroxymethyltransferase [Microdochium nivale]|nr:3-methyl-2-oxobutanoate hydroxymethyltransferase [Microdochium nivale]